MAKFRAGDQVWLKFAKDKPLEMGTIEEYRGNEVYWINLDHNRVMVLEFEIIGLVDLG